MGKHRNHFALRSEAYQHCQLCEAEIPTPTAGHLRKHYRTFHLITKEAAIDELIANAKQAKPTAASITRIRKAWDDMHTVVKTFNDTHFPEEKRNGQ